MRKRRAILTALALAASAAVALPAPSPARATGATTPVTHVIVLMMENHTFDSELGDWCSQTARCDGIPRR